jgi:rhamnose utilization protein RhaD (predicted bifunctional aldolase and dehydrogenase)
MHVNHKPYLQLKYGNNLLQTTTFQRHVYRSQHRMLRPAIYAIYHLLLYHIRHSVYIHSIVSIISIACATTAHTHMCRNIQPFQTGRWLPTRRPGFSPGSGQVAPGQVFSEYFGFPCHLFHQILHPHNQPGQVQ